MIAHLSRLALGNLTRSPFRSLLILQGITWGTALAIAPSAVIRGSLRHAEEQAVAVGTNRLLIDQDTMATSQAFDWNLAQELLDVFPDLEAATGLAVLENPDTPIIIVNDDFLEARGQVLTRGKTFSGPRNEPLAPDTFPALVESKALSYFPDDPLGATLTINDEKHFEVIGIVAPRETEGLTDSLGYEKDHPMSGLLNEITEYLGYFADEKEELLQSDSAIVVPSSAYPETAPQWIELRAPPSTILALKKNMGDYLAARGYEPLISTHALLSVLYGETVKTMMEMNRIIFAMALLVGTTVVCVLMILTVMERQREIAIRRVEGARRWHIALQFTVETGVLCAIGGLLGVPLGLFLAFLRTQIEILSGVTWAIPWSEAVIVLALVTAGGFLGGLLPAWRATRVDPVEILRTE